MEFSQRLRELRKEIYITQEELSKNLSISVTQLNDIERGIAEPTINELLKVVSYFKVPVGYLCGLDERVSINVKFFE